MSFGRSAGDAAICPGFYEVMMMFRQRGTAMWRGLRSLASDCAGVSMVEFALGATLLLGALSPLVDLGLAFSQRTKLQNAADAGAQYASFNPWSSNSASNIQSAVNNATTQTLTWTATPTEFCGCPNSTSTQITNTGSPPCSGTPSGCSEPAGYYVTFTVSYNYTPVMPFSILSNPTTLTAQPVVRVQ